MKILFILVFFIILYSCSSQNVKITPQKIKILPIESYIPKDTSLVIKNNKYNSVIFSKNYDENVKYEFIYKNKEYFLTSSKPEGNFIKLSSCYLTPVTIYHTNKFEYDIKNYDFFYRGNLFGIISLTKNELTILSTGNKNKSLPFQKIPKFIEIKNTSFIMQEENPLFFDKAVKMIDFSYDFNSISSYLLVRYKKAVKKIYLDKEKLLRPYILIVTLKDFDEIINFKEILKRTMFYYDIDLKTVFSDKGKRLYIIFEGDKIIFLKDLNVYYFLEKLNKIPLTRIKKINLNQGYIFTEDINDIRKIFEIFKKINFKGNINYYFFDYKEER